MRMASPPLPRVAVVSQASVALSPRPAVCLAWSDGDKHDGKPVAS